MELKEVIIIEHDNIKDELYHTVDIRFLHQNVSSIIYTHTKKQFVRVYYRPIIGDLSVYIYINSIMAKLLIFND